MLLLTPEHTRGLLGIGEAIEAVELGFREWGCDRNLNKPRQRVHVPSGVRVSVHQGGSPASGVTGLAALGIRIRQTVENQKAERHADPAYVLFDAETGDLACIILGELTPAEMPDYRVGGGFRTAAASAVGTKALARPDAKTIGLLGGGAQARYHLLAFAAIRPIERVKIFRRDTEGREAFAAEMSAVLGIDVIPVQSAKEALEGTDIVLAATNASVPVFEGGWLDKGQHVTSIVGSNIGLVRSGQRRNKRRELDDQTLTRMDVIAAASREQAMQDEQGDLYDPVQSGLIGLDEIRDIADILTGALPGRTSAEQLTLFKNNAGQGICDVAIGAKILAKARERGLGIEVPVGGY
jgi:alanine dehydrogenase